MTSKERKTSSTFWTTYAGVDVVKRSPDGERALIVASTTPKTPIFTLLAARRSIDERRKFVTDMPPLLRMLAGMIVIWAPESATASFTLNSFRPPGVAKDSRTSSRGWGDAPWE